jgi:hypothetical protein
MGDSIEHGGVATSLDTPHIFRFFRVASPMAQYKSA